MKKVHEKQSVSYKLFAHTHKIACIQNALDQYHISTQHSYHFQRILLENSSEQLEVLYNDLYEYQTPRYRKTGNTKTKMYLIIPPLVYYFMQYITLI